MAVQATLVGRVVLLLLAGVTAAFVGYRVLRPDAPVEALVSDAVPETDASSDAPEPITPAQNEPAQNEPAQTEPAQAASELAPTEVAPASPSAKTDTAALAPDGAAPQDQALVVPAPPKPLGFDVVRIAPDGSALIAGSAPPDAQVSVLLDGMQETRVQADSLGKWVAMFTLAPNPAPRVLGLEATLADGSNLAGAATVAIAPIAAVVPAMPVNVAEATTPLEEPAPPATLLITEGGAEVLAQAPDVPAGEVVPVSLDAISYAPAGAVQLAGQAQGGALLRIYLDSAAVADLRVPDDGGWTTTLPDTAPGIYTLRIDQLNVEGRVTARTETPFKRETLQALAAATGLPAPTLPAPTLPAPALPAPALPDVVSVESAPDPSPAPASEPASLPDATAAEPAPAVTPDLAANPAPEVMADPGPPPSPVAQQTPASATVAPITITVQPGFTLWGIATDMMGEGTMYVQVFEANKDKIRDPDLIYPGQVFTLPQE